MTRMLFSHYAILVVYLSSMSKLMDTDDYSDKGLAVFIHTKDGLMYEAAIGGQKFKFTPKGD